MPFEFATAGRIIFGEGTLSQAAPAARRFGERTLVVLGSSDRAAGLLDQLAESGLEATIYRVDQEPSVETALQGAQLARQADSQVVIGFGGGSVLDTAKAIAALLTNPGDIYDYLEVVGKAQPLTAPSAPCLAIPTTAGTGSEVTRNAVLAAGEQRVKVSLRSPWMLPNLAIVDPELTYSLPPAATAYTGLDALTQVIEPFVSNQSNPLTDSLCREGIQRAARSLKQVYEQGDDPGARRDMCIASLFGGLALANAKLGAVHGFAGPIGGMYPAPHGAVCARLLPFVMEANLQALRLRQADSPTLARYTEIAHLLTEQPDTIAEDGVAWLKELCTTLDIQPLSAYGISPADLPEIVSRAQKASSMKGNPIKLTEVELKEILEKAL